LADMIPGLDDGAHWQEQRFRLDLPCHLGINLLVIPTPVGNLENFAEDGSVNKADAHEDWARRLKSESQASPFSTLAALSLLSGSFRKRSRIPRVTNRPRGPWATSSG